MIDMAVFKQFQDAITHLGEMAQPEPLAGDERVARAKAVMRRKTDRPLALDLESCVNCGYCSEACHFYQGTQDPKYTPTRKLDLLRRVPARESSAFAPIKRLFMRDISIDDLQEFQELVYDSCTECGRCSMVCPMGINIARGVNVMREALSEAGLAPLELMAVGQEQAGRGTVFGVGLAELAGVLETLRCQGISIPLDKPQADVLLVTTVIDVLLFQDAYSLNWRTKRLLASQRRTIDHDLRPVGDHTSRIGRPVDQRNAELARDDRGMGEGSTDFGDRRGGDAEQRSPDRRGRLRYQDIARVESSKVLRS